MNSPSNDNTTKSVAAETCPICQKKTVGEYTPFCSRRCADVDLHRWLSGNYAIPATDEDSDGVRVYTTKCDRSE